MAHEYISQVSLEIEGRETEKLSKEFSRTESRILGVLSKLDKFLLNPQVRSCSVAVPGISRNSGSENRKPTGDRSLNDSCPKAMCSSHHFGNLSGSELEETHHPPPTHTHTHSLTHCQNFFQLEFQTDNNKISGCFFTLLKNGWMLVPKILNYKEILHWKFERKYLEGGGRLADGGKSQCYAQFRKF